MHNLPVIHNMPSTASHYGRNPTVSSDLAVRTNKNAGVSSRRAPPRCPKSQTLSELKRVAATHMKAAADVR
jgi:hypothetical protein